MNLRTVFEFGKVVAGEAGAGDNTVPPSVFAWLESQCLENDDGAPAWLKLCRDGPCRAIQFTSRVGVVRAPCGYQIEILPKIGHDTSVGEARLRLMEMLQCLQEFRHTKLAAANLATARMPLLEVFIQQFLGEVAALVRRGLRSDYIAQEGNLPALRGRLMIAHQISKNLVRPDRFYTQHDEFSQDRAENRLIHSALRIALRTCKSYENQRLARELCFAFADVPLAKDVACELKRIRLDRGMGYYAAALDWAKLILARMSPTAVAGQKAAQSFLFPMDALFEAYVGKHVARQLHKKYSLHAQSSSHHLVAHRHDRWFKMKPDLIVRDRKAPHLVLDVKWKRLDAAKDNGKDKYQLSQSDFYQMYAYGHHYLDGQGAIVLIYPKTDAFAKPLPFFDFPKTAGMRLWVLPFCLDTRKLVLPPSMQLDQFFPDSR
jgi:5-methylcytosine-specific restriction enzyme subunit McrC